MISEVLLISYTRNTLLYKPNQLQCTPPGPLFIPTANHKDNGAGVARTTFANSKVKNQIIKQRLIVAFPQTWVPVEGRWLLSQGWACRDRSHGYSRWEILQQLLREGTRKQSLFSWATVMKSRQHRLSPLLVSVLQGTQQSHNLTSACEATWPTSIYPI